MFSKVLGGTLLIIGTSVGAGMLALPVATAAGEFYHSLWLFLAAWSVMTLGAFFILEVNLWLPEKTNLVSMAKATLGPIGQVLTWVVYLLLLYSLLSAYTAGGADLSNNFLTVFHIKIPYWLNSTLFVLILGGIVHQGVYIVDLANRFLMTIKLISYFFLVFLLLPHANFNYLYNGSFPALGPAIMVVITAFGYATIIPSLRYYFNSRVNPLRLTVFLGSLGSLIIYVLWVFAVQSTVQNVGSDGLSHMAISGHTASDLTTALSRVANSALINNLAHIFTTICVTTSFLGVGLCLEDFLSDGMHIKKRRTGKWLISATTFIPPLAVVLIYPGAFILGLNYAGVCSVLLLMFLPALMVWSGRYIKKINQGYQVFGGKWLVILEIFISLILLIIAFLQLK